MKLSQVLNRQHIGFMFKKHWLIQGKRVPIDTGAEQYLKKKGIPVEDALEFVKEKSKTHEKINIVGPYEQPIPLDENHPDYKEKPCLTLRNNTVLLEGISQAQVLTKTVIADGKLPTKIEELAEVSPPSAVHDNVKKAILSANVFDCEQNKLPKIKDVKRPAYNFPRILGITDRRRNQILTNKLVQLVEKCSDTELTQRRYVSNDVESHVVFNKEDDLIQFQDVSNILVTNNTPLKHDVPNDIPFVEIPDLYPIKHTITLPPEHFYIETSKYRAEIHAIKLWLKLLCNNPPPPCIMVYISKHAPCPPPKIGKRDVNKIIYMCNAFKPSVSVKHPHTTWLHYNRTEVSNIYETPVTPSQVLGKSLTHAFTIASAYAKQLHGEDVKDLPEPIYINCIHTDGQNYHFGVFELNTLNVDGKEGTKNVFYCKNNIKMYDSCRYFSGRPVLENYNPNVYGYINAFYNC